jgi:hypothetical protein
MTEHEPLSATVASWAHRVTFIDLPQDVIDATKLRISTSSAPRRRRRHAVRPRDARRVRRDVCRASAASSRR